MRRAAGRAGSNGSARDWAGKSAVTAAMFLRLSCGAVASRAQGASEGALSGLPQPETVVTAPDIPAQADPPGLVARLSYLQGNVSAQGAAAHDFSAAELNQVLTSGDRLYTDNTAEAELEVGQLGVRLGGATDLTVTALTDQLAQLGLAAGSVHLRSYALLPGTVLELDTPEAAITALQPGDVRVDEDPAGHLTTIAVLSGQAQVDGPGISQVMNAGDRLRIHGVDPATEQQAYAEPLPAGSADALDGFSESRDNQYADGAQAYGDSVNPEATGSADLGNYGSWDTSADFGPVWFPVVAVDWRPYCDGHWRWVAPWGWTWIGAEPWGFAPFHYGRWISVDGRWGWLPGPSRLRAVYAPALVAFAGGRQFSAALGYGPGSGPVAWFPLGPGDAFQPSYPVSTLYRYRINASNLPNSNAAEARAFYNQRAVDIYGAGGTAPHSRQFENRTAGTVAVPQETFASGRSVLQNQLRLSAVQLAAAPVLTAPGVLPDRSVVVTGPARAVPTSLGRAAETQLREAHRDGELAGAEHDVRPAFFRAPLQPAPGRAGAERLPLEHPQPGRVGAPGVSGVREGSSRPAAAPRSPAPAPAEPGRQSQPAPPHR